MAEQITFDINAKDNASATLNRVSNNLTKMQKGVAATSGAFEKFRNTLVGLGAINFVSNTLKWADSIQDLADATNLATGDVLGFSNAVSMSGGNAEKAEQGLLKFIGSIGEAAEGSLKTQNAFAKVGVTLNDLRTLSEKEILNKTIQGLAQIRDTAERATVQTEIFSKALRTTDIPKVAGNIGIATAEGAKYAESIQKAAAVQENLELTLRNLRIALLEVLGPIADVAKDLSASVETIKNVIKVLLILGAAVASMTLLGRAAAILAGAFRVLAGAAEAIQALFINLSIRIGNLGRVGAILSDALASIGTWFSQLISKSPKLAQGIEYIAAAFTPLVGLLGAAATGFGLFGDKSEKVIDDMNKASMEAHAASRLANEQEKAQLRQVADALEEKRQGIINVTKEYQKQNDIFIKGLQDERRSFTMSKDNLEIVKAQEQVYQDAINTIDDLYRAKAQLKPEEIALGKVIDEQIATIEKNIGKNQERATQAIQEIQKMRMAEEDLQRSIQATADAFRQSEALQDLQDQLDLIGLYGEELEKQQIIMAAEKALREEMQRLTVELLQLEAERTRIGEEAYNKERQRVTQQMMDAKALSEAKIAAFEKEQKRKQEIEQSYAEGAKRALDDIAEQYKPINMAQEAIRKGWGSIESAVDNFVESGKFKFSDFARSVVQDLAKMIAKALIFKAISSALGAFGLKIPGMAAGGPVEAGKAYMVGEKGPELFVPPGSGKIIPNDKLRSGNGGPAQTGPITNNYNTYNINALDAKSVAQVFAENRKAIFGANKMAEREMSYAGAR
jgi:lambda family phage tail tape measure protein